MLYSRRNSIFQFNRHGKIAIFSQEKTLLVDRVPKTGVNRAIHPCLGIKVLAAKLFELTAREKKLEHKEYWPAYRDPIPSPLVDELIRTVSRLVARHGSVVSHAGYSSSSNFARVEVRYTYDCVQNRLMNRLLNWTSDVFFPLSLLYY